MRVKLLVSRVSNDGAQNRGDEIDVPAEEGRAMIDAGQAELVREAAPEKAVKAAKAERAAK